MNMTELYWMPAMFSTPSYVSTPAERGGSIPKLVG